MLVVENDYCLLFKKMQLVIIFGFTYTLSVITDRV